MGDAETSRPRHWRVGCVSYLNAKPLIHAPGNATATPGNGAAARGNDAAFREAVNLQLDVPSRLIGRLTSGEVDVALCSIVDFFRGGQPLELVPVGGIGCAGPTLTVRLFSRVPIENITTVHADTDSHTSVLLLRVLLADLYGLSPRMIHYDTRASETGSDPIFPEAVLLIGDKVVTAGPAATVYPYQLDLGAAWHDLTGRPFVFATWMKRRGTDLGGLPLLLEKQLKANLARLDEIVAAYAAPHGWPADLAAEYLGEILRYRVGADELAAVEHFATRLSELRLIATPDPGSPRKLTRG